MKHAWPSGRTHQGVSVASRSTADSVKRPEVVSLYPFARQWTRASAAASPLILPDTEQGSDTSPSPKAVAESASSTNRSTGSEAEGDSRADEDAGGERFRFPVVSSSATSDPQLRLLKAHRTPDAASADEEEMVAWRRRLALLESENAALRSRLERTMVNPDSLVRNLQRQVRALTLARDAAEAALVDLQEEYLSVRQQLRTLQLQEQRQQPVRGASPPVVASVPQNARELTRQTQVAPLASRERSVGSAKPVRRSQTVEGYDAPTAGRQSPAPPQAKLSWPGQPSGPHTTTSFEAAGNRRSWASTASAGTHTPYHPLPFSDEARARRGSRPRGVAVTEAEASSQWGSDQLSRMIAPGVSLEGIEELVRRSQRLREVVGSRSVDNTVAQSFS